MEEVEAHEEGSMEREKEGNMKSDARGTQQGRIPEMYPGMGGSRIFGCTKPVQTKHHILAIGALSSASQSCGRNQY